MTYNYDRQAAVLVWEKASPRPSQFPPDPVLLAKTPSGYAYGVIPDEDSWRVSFGRLGDPLRAVYLTSRGKEIRKCFSQSTELPSLEVAKAVAEAHFRNQSETDPGVLAKSLTRQQRELLKEVLEGRYDPESVFMYGTSAQVAGLSRMVSILHKMGLTYQNGHLTDLGKQVAELL